MENKSLITLLGVEIVLVLMYMFLPRFEAATTPSGPKAPSVVTTYSGITEVLQTSRYGTSFSLWVRPDKDHPAVEKDVYASRASIFYDVLDGQDAWAKTYDSDYFELHLHHPGELGGSDTGGKGNVQIVPLK